MRLRQAVLHMHQLKQGPVQLIPPAAHREEAGEVSAPSPLAFLADSLRERPTPKPSRMLRTKWTCCTSSCNCERQNGVKHRLASTKRKECSKGYPA